MFKTSSLPKLIFKSSIAFSTVLPSGKSTLCSTLSTITVTGTALFIFMLVVNASTSFINTWSLSFILILALFNTFPISLQKLTMLVVFTPSVIMYLLFSSKVEDMDVVSRPHTITAGKIFLELRSSLNLLNLLIELKDIKMFLQRVKNDKSY